MRISIDSYIYIYIYTHTYTHTHSRGGGSAPDDAIRSAAGASDRSISSITISICISIIYTNNLISCISDCLLTDICVYNNIHNSNILHIAQLIQVFCIIS